MERVSSMRAEIHPPPMAARIPEHPRMAAERMSALLFFRLRSVPEIDVQIMTPAEVPLAMTGGMEKRTIMAGTITTPPPTPSRPARIPVHNPTRTSAAAMAAALVLVGLCTGILAGLLGVGGGVVMVPAMMVLFSIPPVIAKGTSAGVMICTSISGTLRNRKNNNADMRSAAILGCSGILAAIGGGWISARMDDTLSNVLFACLLVVVAVRLLLEVRNSH